MTLVFLSNISKVSVHENYTSLHTAPLKISLPIYLFVYLPILSPTYLKGYSATHVLRF